MAPDQAAAHLGDAGHARLFSRSRVWSDVLAVERDWLWLEFRRSPQPTEPHEVPRGPGEHDRDVHRREDVQDLRLLRCRQDRVDHREKAQSAEEGPEEQLVPSHSNAASFTLGWTSGRSDLIAARACC